MAERRKNDDGGACSIAEEADARQGITAEAIRDGLAVEMQVNHLTGQIDRNAGGK